MKKKHAKNNLILEAEPNNFSTSQLGDSSNDDKMHQNEIKSNHTVPNIDKSNQASITEEEDRFSTNETEIHTNKSLVSTLASFSG